MEEPNIIDKAKNLVNAMTNWATIDKFGRLNSDAFNYRKQICIVCPYWNPDAFAGLGSCKKCGCSVAKLYIPSSKCPDDPPHWSPISVSASYTEGNVP